MNTSMPSLKELSKKYLDRDYLPDFEPRFKGRNDIYIYDDRPAINHIHIELVIAHAEDDEVFA